MKWFRQNARVKAGVLVLILVLIAGSALAYRKYATNRVRQPIAFNHRAHVKTAEIACSECHPYYATGRHSGLPEAETCMTCHSDPLTKSPEEAKLRERFGRGEPVVFRKLFRLPSHVYYSHRRHVVLGKLECEKCHGKIADTEVPPEVPLVEMSMDFCTKCHTRSSVTNDCKSCHN